MSGAPPGPPFERRWVKPGVLYVVATPIGNLADVSRRAEDVLGEVDVIAAEDTRVTGRLLQHLGVNRPLLSLHAHSSPDRLEEILGRLAAGEAVALVSDAGLPAVSDPGAELVAACWDRHLPVSPIPGASAGVTAFSGSGFGLPWVQWGFLPARGAERRERLAEVLKAPGAQVLYESPHRVRPLLEDLVKAGAGDRLVVLARELTKLHEQWWRGPVREARAAVGDGLPLRGEWTVVLGPDQDKPAAAWSWAAALEAVNRLVVAGTTESDACRLVAEQVALPRRELYRRWHARSQPPTAGISDLSSPPRS